MLIITIDKIIMNKHFSKVGVVLKKKKSYECQNNGE